MRVFCPEHKRGFFAPRQNPIKCENRSHPLGQLDFEGQASLPVEIQWQYCCNCEHFCPVDFDQYGLQRCPVCKRRSSLLYLCDRCHVISFESNTPLQIKNFTLTSEGAPQPSCPGCLQPASVDLYEHSCEELGVSFITSLRSCPVCEERLDDPPAFPSSVALYLKKTKSANKLNVTFDYETESFVPIEDGEFVVVTNGNQHNQPIVLPRAGQFATRRDFYELYQDYYHCPEPIAGEVHIIEPAVVVRTENGWKLQGTGVLEVVGQEPKEAQAAPLPAKREEPGPVVTPAMEQLAVTPCDSCGSLIETQYAFCWKCGNELEPRGKPRMARGHKPRTIISRAPIATDDDELTVQHDLRSAAKPMFSWTMATESRSSLTRGSVLRLIAIATVALILVSLGAFVLTRSNSRVASVATSEPVSENDLPAEAAGVSPASSPESKLAAPEVTPALKTVNPDDELKRLREKRMTASASERSRIFQAFATIERQYPRDYRFPYERAKLAVKGSQASSRSDAFKALSVAAERAINTGKANEMLSGLEADRVGDFQRLATGHHEWTRLLAALKRKDLSLLSAKAQFQ